MIPEIILKSCYQSLADITTATKTTIEKPIIEEVVVPTTEKSNWLITLSYDIIGDFAFDKKRVYKIFEIKDTGELIQIKIRNDAN